MDLETMPYQVKRSFTRFRNEHPDIDNDTLAELAENTVRESEIEPELWEAVDALLDH